MPKWVRYSIYIGSAVFILANKEFRSLVKNCFDLRAMKHQSVALDKSIIELQTEKARLINRKDDYLERLTRKELNFTRPGEIEFRFTPPRKK
ncbi:MAG: septum formation initiator family protein [Elusimicrobia bacterium]|nr:septum formation initiator family protein [Elusimicrobiota bacterium]